jgi:hypothetical protein
MTTRHGPERCRLILGAMTISSIAAALGAQNVNPQAAAVKAFQDRVAAYIKLRDEVAAKAPPLEETSDPANITLRERQLGAALRQARGQVAPGDVFGPELSSFIIHIVRSNWARRSKIDRRALLGDQPKNVPVEVNVLYPPNVPLATFPPALLAALPTLPKGLEYRFYGRHLILRDAEAGLIVDMIPNILPM